MGDNSTIVTGWGQYPKVPTHLRKWLDGSSIDHPEGLQGQIARGAGRSYADQAVAENGITWDFTGQQRILAFNHATGILHAEAGLDLATIIQVFAPRGWFPQVCPGTKYVTLGGAIANDIHGKGHHKTGTFASCLLEMQLVLPHGELVVASRTKNAELFWATVGGLGLTGFIATATIQLRQITNTWFRQKTYSFSGLADCFNLFAQYDGDYEYSVGWINTSSPNHKGVITFGNHAELADVKAADLSPFALHKDPALSVPFSLPTGTLNAFSIGILNQTLAFLQKRKQGLTTYDPFFFPLDSIKHWYRGYGKKGFVQYQFVLPMDAVLEGIPKLLSLLKEEDAMPFLNVIKRFGESNEGWLSFPMKGYTLALDFALNTKTVRTLKKCDELVMAFGGRTYLAKDAVLNAHNFGKMYPKKPAFIELKHKLDPKCQLRSAIAERIGICNFTA